MAKAITTFMKMQPSFGAQVRAEADEKTDAEKAEATHSALRGAARCRIRPWGDALWKTEGCRWLPGPELR